MHILIVNGSTPYPDAKGALTAALVQQYQQCCEQRGWSVETSLTGSFDIVEEQAKITRADLIIFQFPVYWYQVPSGLKRYLDEILTMDFAYYASEEYAHGPALTGKRYLVSTTWAAPETATKAGGFLARHSLEEIFLPLALTMKFCGIEKVQESPVSFWGVHDKTVKTDYETVIKGIIGSIDPE